MKLKTKHVVVAAGALALFAVVLNLSRDPAEKGKNPGFAEILPPASVTLATAALSDSPQFLEATGVVHAELDASVATKVQGTVMQVFVREGDFVRRGQPLLNLDARDLDAAVTQAEAGVRNASVGYDNARVAASMEHSMSTARIAQARAAVANAEAALQSARAMNDMVLAGPRRQERSQAALAVVQAQSGLTLAKKDLDRMNSLFQQGAVARQQLDAAQSRYEVAGAQLETAVEAKSIADEGSRSEDVRSAAEAVRQAQAGLNQARAGLKQAQAAAKQVDVRRAEIRGAQAQIGQGRAALRMARVTREYATLTAPFDGVVVRRLVDPGALASPGVPLLQLQGGALRLNVLVPEGSLSAARRGTPVTVELDALNGTSLKGRVVEVSPQGDATSHTFTVKVQLPPGSSAKAGMFGRARLRTGASTQVLVPTEAVTVRDGLSYIHVVDGDNLARLRMVTVGKPEAGKIPVYSGLAPGERFVTSGDVKDGQETKPSA